MEPIDISYSNEIYTVSRLNREVRLVLEGSFSTIWIEGEVSNFAAPHSGHWYFSLKDPLAQIRCAMFKMQNQRLNFVLKDGMHVLVKARISLYEGRGDFQLLIEHLEEAGEGKLRQEFEALKKRLHAAGLFDEKYKKKLPSLPQTIGIITSLTGAAIQDILNVLKRRFAHANIIIYPSLVQGKSAAQHIVNALEIANQRNECHVLILARGGGSLEDLWAFNEEIVAQAIFNCSMPVISGVGHEIDFTIADFVADVRAPTPSAAAELATPRLNDLLDMLDYSKKQLVRLIYQHINKLKQHLHWIQKHLQQQHPKHRLITQAQQLDLNEITLIKLQNKLLLFYENKLQILSTRFLAFTPKFKIQEWQRQLINDRRHLDHCMTRLLQSLKLHLSQLTTKLDALSPLSTLQRGFAVVTKEKEADVLLQASQVKIGELLRIRLATGELYCRVEVIL